MQHAARNGYAVVYVMDPLLRFGEEIRLVELSRPRHAAAAMAIGVARHRSVLVFVRSPHMAVPSSPFIV